jgi:hydroxypyruvate reductase/glycerate 2-kinase
MMHIEDNRRPKMTHASSSTPRDAAVEIFQAALAAADPYRAVAAHLDRVLSVYRNGGYERICAVAFGKAAASMMQAVADRCGDLLTRAVVVTKYGHAGTARLPSSVEVYEAGHPLPDENGVAATRRVLDVLKTADAKTLVLCLISGGGSALLVAPCDGLALPEKQAVTDSLLKAGADIVELNTVRKHLSAVKGGRLAAIAHPASVVSLILSDVIGDPIGAIASGPTAPAESTFADAVRVLRKYDLFASLPPGVRVLLERGVRGEIRETPKGGAPALAAVENLIVGSNGIATAAAVRKAEELGFRAVLLATALRGEAREVARELARSVLQRSSGPGTEERRCFVAGGETTVTVRGAGLGGRNTELALSFALEIEGVPGITMLSAGTDGTDGPTDAAGAVVDGRTIPRARSRGLDPERALAENDSYTFFQSAGGLVMTGPTGTNVMDIQLVLEYPAR